MVPHACQFIPELKTSAQTDEYQAMTRFLLGGGVVTHTSSSPCEESPVSAECATCFSHQNSMSTGSDTAEADKYWGMTIFLYSCLCLAKRSNLLACSHFLTVQVSICSQVMNFTTSESCWHVAGKQNREDTAERKTRWRATWMLFTGDYNHLWRSCDFE